jgi:porin
MPRAIDRAVSTLSTVTATLASFVILATLSAAPVFAQDRENAAAGQTTPKPATQTVPANTTSLQELLGRDNLFGDWGGARTKMQNAGTKFDVTFTQFFQWAPQTDTPPLGDVTQHYLYGGKFDVMDTSDLSKIAWKGLSVTGHLEVRYGDVPLLTGGTLIPTNTALLFPENQDTKARLSALNFTQVLNSHASVSIGRFNMVDLYDRAYTGGRGIDKFMNLSFVMPPISIRTVPPVAEGVIFSILNGSDVVATAGLIESTDEGFFKNGATVLWNVALPVHLFTMPGHYSVGGQFSSTVATSLDQSAWLLLPPFNTTPATVQGAWTLNVSFDQAIAVDPNDSKKNFGVFGVLGVSDANPTPIQPFFTIGVGGHSLLRSRPNDTFGVAYALNGLSSDFVTFVQPARLRNEQGGELYYNVAIAPWSLVTADLQFVDPYALGSSTRTFFAIRWKLIF